ncbi:MAG: CDC48 family AAA ATPase [Candidatus Hydrothermarchaeaceae archaeon]
MEIELKVAEALQNDVGRGIVRLDTKTRDKLGISTGDIVEIVGKKSTGAIVWRAYSEDEGLGIIRMDGIIRQNAEISLGDRIKLKAASVSDARKAILAPAQAIRFSPGFGDFVKRRLLGRPITTGDRLVVGVLGTTLHFSVVQTLPGKISRITDYTEIVVKEEPLKAEKGGIPSIAYEDIGGLTEEVKKIREMIELPMKHPELFDKLGIEPPKGVLLHGPPGTGKTLIAKAVANETNAYFIPLNGPEIMSKFYGESEERLRRMFKEAETNAPSIIFIDELDAIAPKREEVHGEVERRVVAQLLALMDGMKGRGRVIVIGATNRPNALDPALRRPGRFDREIVIGVPDRNGRKEILQIHTRGMPFEGEKEEQEDLLNELADISHGFVGADLEALCKEAAMGALRKVLPKIDLKDEIISPEVLEDLKVTKADFVEALKLVEPSALREVFVEIPDVGWEDVGGLKDIKRELVEAVEWPIKHPEAFTKMGIAPPRGILIFGPPGSGKTLLAKAAANESEANFISVKGPEILSKWVGESEKAVREIFKKAKQVAPTIIFMDEIDAISAMRGLEVGSRVGERVLNQMLIEMDGIEELHNVVVLAATNRPDLLDPALLRPGRFDKVLLVPAPDAEARDEIFKVHTRDMPLDESVSLSRLARETENFVGADVEALCREAATLAIREVLSNGENIDEKKVTNAHFQEALKKVRSSVTEDIMKSYEGFLSRFEAKEMEKLTYMG